jgi:peptidoglycan/xylan/chitin deacetylase (PgdA/CDA1 family)
MPGPVVSVRNAAAVRVLSQLTRMLLGWRDLTPRSAGMPVLTYHSIGDESWGDLSRYRIPRQRFRQHMSFLAAAGFNVVPLETVAVRLVAAAPSVPANWVALTFDDGYEDFYVNALPELRKQGFPATVFVVSDLMGRSAEWLGPSEATPLMTWAQARAAVPDRISFSSHSCTHPHLPQLAATALRREVVESRQVIEDNVGAPASLFCYPHGDFDDRVRSAVCDTGYAAAFSTEVGLIASGHDRYALQRVKVRPHDSLADFVAKLFTGQGLRASWRGARRRGVR